MHPKTLSLIQINAAVLLWGGTAMFGKGLDLPVTDIICGRALTGAAGLLLFLLAFKTPIRVKRTRHWGIMLILGLALCVHWLTYFHALRVSSAAVAIISLHTYPIFTALIEPFVFRERLRKADVLLAIAVFIGIVIMTPEISFSNSTTQGILVGVFSGIFFMARNLLTRKYVQEYSGSMLIFWQMLITGLVLLPFVLTSETTYTPKSIGLLWLLGIVFTAAPQTLFSSSFRNLSAKTVGILGTLLVFWGGVLGYFIHDEKVTLRTAIGGAIVLACIVVETLRSMNGKVNASASHAFARKEQ